MYCLCRICFQILGRILLLCLYQYLRVQIEIGEQRYILSLRLYFICWYNSFVVCGLVSLF